MIQFRHGKRPEAAQPAPQASAKPAAPSPQAKAAAGAPAWRIPVPPLLTLEQLRETSDRYPRLPVSEEERAAVESGGADHLL